MDVFKYLYPCFCMVTLLGCQVLSQQQAKSSLNGQARLSYRPDWVVSPEHEGFLSVIGYAPKQDDGSFETQHRVAILKAEQELAQIRRVRVKNTVDKSLADFNAKIKNEAEISTQLASNTSISMANAKETKQWVDPADGSLYLLIEITE